MSTKSPKTVATAAYGVDTFCAAHGISRGMLYKLWLAGTGPKYKQVGNRRIISTEAAADWRNSGVV